MKYLELVTAVKEIMSNYTVRLTLRQVYYRLVAAGLIANTRSDYNQLSSQLVKARENSDIDDLEDRSRRIDDISFDSPESFIKACQDTLERQYVRRFWDSQPVYCEVWVEKDALSQVIAEAVYPFNTIVAPSRGYSSYSYLKDASERIKRYCAGGKSAVILHFADHDPSGIDMTRDLQDRLDKHCNGDSLDLSSFASFSSANFERLLSSNSPFDLITPVEVKRVALTYDQVRRYSLIPNPVKQADRRSSAYVSQYGDQCWELDAIEPNELITLCRAAVDTLIEDRDAWLAIKERDKAERQALLAQLQRMNGE